MNRKTMLVLAPLVLSACGSDRAAEKADDGRSAEGEVLGGSISDDMLPLDTVKSQSPPLRVKSAEAASDGAEAADDPVAEDAAEEPAEPAAEEAPAEALEESDEG